MSPKLYGATWRPKPGAGSGGESEGGATTGPTLDGEPDDERVRTDQERVFERGCGAVVYESVCATFVQQEAAEEPLALAVAGDARMPKGGFEPPRPVRHHPLKMACLPFPPLRHFTPGKTGFRGAREAQHSACARPLSNGFLGPIDVAIAPALPVPRARVRSLPAGLRREQSAAPRVGRWRPGPDR